jgi:Spy/CpxP family protein refolding chaperone
MNGILTGVLVTLGVLALLRLGRVLLFRRRWRHRGWMARRLLRRIEATPEQERLFLAELDALRGAMREAREGFLASREDLARALESERLDVPALEAVASAPMRRLDAARIRAAEALARFHAALEPRQRQLLAAALREGPALGRRGPHPRPC